MSAGSRERNLDKYGHYFLNFKKLIGPTSSYNLYRDIFFQSIIAMHTIILYIEVNTLVFQT